MTQYSLFLSSHFWHPPSWINLSQSFENWSDACTAASRPVHRQPPPPHGSALPGGDFLAYSLGAQKEIAALKPDADLSPYNFDAAGLGQAGPDGVRLFPPRAIPATGKWMAQPVGGGHMEVTPRPAEAATTSRFGAAATSRDATSRVRHLPR